MKWNSISLHTNTRWTLLIVVLFAVLSTLLVSVVTMIADNHLGRLVTLKQSSYLYSVNMKESIGQDDYYLFDAGIVFTLSVGSNRGVNADAVMQTAESEYTDIVSWKVGKLSTSEIAISQDVARTYGLDVGDKLYSRHTVDGMTHEYTIKQLLPHIASFSASAKSTYSDGVIVMGYDKQYVENIANNVIVFTDEQIDVLARKYSETPVNIVYRDDETETARAQLIPFVFLLVSLAVMLTVAFVYFLTHDIVCDYKRLIKLGFMKRQLDFSYVFYITSSFLLAVLITILSSLLLFHILVFNFVDIWFLFLMLLGELSTLIISVSLIKWRVWRV